MFDYQTRMKGLLFLLRVRRRDEQFGFVLVLVHAGIQVQRIPDVGGDEHFDLVLWLPVFGRRQRRRLRSGRVHDARDLFVG